MQIPPINFTPVITPPAPVGKQQEAQTASEEESRVFSPVDETTELTAKQAFKESPEQAKERALERQPAGVSQEEESEARARESDDNRGNSALEKNRKLDIAELVTRDREVRAHEQAHSSVGGAFAGPAEFKYTVGPDGKRYATSGEVGIDVGRVANDPRATIAKADQVQRAALAPADPSAQDRLVASAAARMKLQATHDLAKQGLEERRAEEQQRKELEQQKSTDEAYQKQKLQAQQEREQQATGLRDRQKEQAQLQQERLFRTGRDIIEAYSTLERSNRSDLPESAPIDLSV